MSGRFVRASKYRHLHGRSTKKDQCYDNLQVSSNAWDTNLINVNPKHIAVNWQAGGGGAFAIIPLEERGKLPAIIPLCRGHTAAVLDTDWHPFNDDVIASGSDDAKVLLWRVPENFTVRPEVESDEIEDIRPIGKLIGHNKKVGHVLFNPAAENVLATASGDSTVKIWDVEHGLPKLTLNINELVQSQSWNADGSRLVTSSRGSSDKKLKRLRIWDARQQRPTDETDGHTGTKGIRAIWLGERDRIVTTGFSKMSERQLALWDTRAMREPINLTKLDSSPGVCMPFWDDGTSCLYLAGRGDGNIRYFELEKDNFEFLGEYKSTDPQRGVAFMPKRGVNIHDNEVARAYKTVNDQYIEPVSFAVPRISKTFQDDLFPPTTGVTPAMSCTEWLDGKNGIPPKVSMASLFDGEGMKEVEEVEEKPTDSIETPAPKAAEGPKVSEPSSPNLPGLAAEPTLASRPAPSMKDQGASMASMVDKFADDEEGNVSDDDASSFEQVPTTVRSTPKAEPSPKISSPIRLEETTPKSNISLSTILSPASESPSTSASIPKNEIEDIKHLIAAQTKTLAEQAQQMQTLTAEIEALKSKMN